MEYLLWLQSIRSDVLNVILMAVTDFITSPVMYLAMAIIYWCFDKRAAYYIAMNISSGSLINQALKNTFCVYRPWIRNSDIKPFSKAVEGATGYSFPSGHTQVASSEFLSVAVWQRKRKWLVGVCVFVTLLVMFTRNYLGVHTLSDVTVSLAVSLVVIFVNAKILNWADGGKNRDWVVFGVGIALCVAFLVYVTVKPYPMDYDANGNILVDPKEMITDCYAAAGCAVGFFSGWISERRIVDFDTAAPTKRRVGRAVVGSLILLVIALFGRDLLTAIHPWWGEFAFFAIAFLYILFLYPLMFTCWERRHS